MPRPDNPRHQATPQEAQIPDIPRMVEFVKNDFSHVLEVSEDGVHLLRARGEGEERKIEEGTFTFEDFEEAEEWLAKQAFPREAQANLPRPHSGYEWAWEMTSKLNTRIGSEKVKGFGLIINNMANIYEAIVDEHGDIPSGQTTPQESS